MSYQNVDADVNICLDEYVNINFDIDLADLASGVAENLEIAELVEAELGKWSSVVTLARTVIEFSEMQERRNREAGELRQELAAAKAVNEALRKELEALEDSDTKSKSELETTSSNGSEA